MERRNSRRNCYQAARVIQTSPTTLSDYEIAREGLARKDEKVIGESVINRHHASSLGQYAARPDVRLTQ